MKTRASQIFMFFCLILIVCSFLIKSIGWDDPYFGFKYGRQVSTLNTIEAYARVGVDFLRPYTYFTPHGWQQFELHELPIYQALSAWSSAFTKTVLSASRGVNLFFALLTLLVVFQIAATYFCRETATYAALFFAFAPLNLMYQSATLMDVSTVFFASLAYWLLAKYFKGTQNITLFFMFLLAGGYCVVTKPLYFLPSVVLLVTHFFQQWKWPRIKNLLGYTVRHRAVSGLFVLLAFIMFFWIEVQKEVNPDSTNVLKFISRDLFNHLFDAIFYARILFRWILLALNPVTFLFFILGVLMLFRDRGREQLALFYSIIAYHIFFGGMLSGHEYYLLPMVPFFSVIAGCGARWIEERIQSDFRIRSRHALSAVIILGTTICSVLLHSVNYIAAQDLEQRTATMEKEMHGVLEQEKYALIIYDQTNFPIHDYVVYNRTAKLKYFVGLLSKEQVRLLSSPLRPPEVLTRLKTYGYVAKIPGNIKSVFSEALVVFVKKALMKSQGHLRYLIFYRFTEKAKAEIKNKMDGYKLVYKSENWLVYDLASG